MSKLRFERAPHATLLNRALQPAFPPEVFYFSRQAERLFDVAEPQAIGTP